MDAIRPDEVAATKDFLAAVGGTARAGELLNLAAAFGGATAGPLGSFEPKTATAKVDEAPKPKRTPASRKPKADGEKRQRASAEEVQARKDMVLGVLKGQPGTKFSRGSIQAALGEDVDSRTLALLVNDGAIKREGEKAQSKYWYAG